MTNHSPFDDHIKKKLGNYEPEVPPHIWDNIKANKEKRRPLFFWLSQRNNLLKVLVPAFILLTGGILLYNKTTRNSFTAKQVSETSGQTGTSLKTISQNNEKDKAEKTLPVNTTVQPMQQNKVEHEFNQQGTDEQQQINIQEKKDLAAGMKIKSFDDQVIKKENQISADKDRRTDEAITAPAINSKTKKTRQTKSTSAFLLTDGDIADQSTAGNNTGSNAQQDLFLQRLPLSLSSMYKSKTFTPEVKRFNLQSLQIPCPEKNAAGNRSYVEIYGGPDFAFRSFSDTPNSAYLEKRKESTSISSAFSADLRYTRVFNNGISFRTGINYSQINEKFSFVQGNIIQVVYVTDANGDTTGSYTTTATRYKKTFNRYRSIDVPVLIGYEIGNGRLHTNINAGAIINVYSWQQGDLLDKSLQPVNINTGGTKSPYQFKTNIGLGFMGAVSLYYKLNNKLHLLAEPYFRYNFSPMSKAELTLKQKYSSAGIRLGVRMDL